MTKPPLLVAPVHPLPTKSEVEEFHQRTQDVLNVGDDQCVSFPYPVTLYQRIDGIWLPVSDLGAFHSSPPAQDKAEPVESSYVPDSQRKWFPCDDAD